MILIYKMDMDCNYILHNNYNHNLDMDSMVLDYLQKLV